ncbi:MAG: hypothetical protein AABX32_06875 [Nanoarchaeota archaeon]
MDDKNGREKLQQELDFLKESFDAEVISKDEYEKGKERVEQKLNEINNHNGNEGDSTGAETAREAKESNDAGNDKSENDNYFEDGDKLSPVTKERTEIRQEETKKETHFEEDNSKESKKESKIFMYAAIFVVLAFVVFFVYSMLDSGITKNFQIKPAALCSSNADCMKENVNSVCINPGTKDAKCQIPEVSKTKVTVLNGRKECFNCDTQRILSLLESWFGTLDLKEVDYNTDEGKSLADKYGINVLPAYVLEEKIINSSSFGQFKQIFIKKNDAYVLKEDAAGSTFYFRRESIPNRLDLFVKSNDAASAKAEKNLQEFLDAFKGVRFEKHVQGDSLTSELNIRTFPAFLINNQVKFSGVQTADVIKTNFCALNKVEECKNNLAKNLI